MDEKDTVYIYALLEPGGSAERPETVRYVGQTDNPERRLVGHIQEAKRRPQWHKSRWINKLIKNNQLPEMAILQRCTPGAWVVCEQFWIQEYKSRGARLTNATIGGEGAPGLSAEALQERGKKTGASLRKRYQSDPTYRERVIAANRRKAQDPEWRREKKEAAEAYAQDPEWQQKHAEGVRRREQNPEFQANRTEAMRRRAEDPEWREKMAEINRRKAQDPEWRRRNKDAAEARAQDPGWLAKNAEKNRRLAQDPEWRRKNTESKEQMYDDPKWQRRQAEGARRNAQDPEWRRRNKEAAEARAQDPGWLAKNAEARQGMYDNPGWRVSISEGKRRARLCRLEEARQRGPQPLLPFPDFPPIVGEPIQPSLFADELEEEE